MPVTKSPLRYPGGKTQLYQFVKEIIALNDINECTYIEPYSGGFGTGVELLLNNDVSSVVINDFDRSIYSLWFSILNHTELLIQLIEQTPISIEEWYRQKEIHEEFKECRYSIENGFSTLFLNRTNRSGIIGAGPIGGYNQEGKYKLDCRFNKTDIVNKIKNIAEQRNRIDLLQLDALQLIDLIPNNYNSQDTFIFFDPPYYVQGKNLYTNFYNHENHEELAQNIASLDDYYWITTYDYSPQIQEMYNAFPNQAFSYELLYSAQKKRKATEFLFASCKTVLPTNNYKVELNPI
ncbi:DNA adenine methylase [Listeria welshimeri]|uniref:DNA adenine methylase n=1 Tax=Listeria welshimeri TaxID=1643 RepID=UPI0018881900|nr:DNA adenine methylase [Listeria welshimeri]MBF2357134.1 DNA adenine methylase [Listeria welshimeri]